MIIMLYHLLPRPRRFEPHPADAPFVREGLPILGPVVLLLGGDGLLVGGLLVAHALREAPAHHLVCTFLVQIMCICQ